MADKRMMWEFSLSYPVMVPTQRYEGGKPTGEMYDRETRTNILAVVLADSLDKAIEAVRAEWPAGSIWNVQHRGNRTVIVVPGV